MEVFDWRLELRVFNEEISPCKVAIAACKESDCDCRDRAADSVCDTFVCSVAANALDTACNNASFSGLGGIGGAGPGANDGSSTSKGEVRRSGVSAFGFTAGWTSEDGR